MTLPEQQRRAYLQAMGIDVWLPRNAGDQVDEPDAGGPPEPVARAEERVVAEAPPAGVNGDWDELRQCVSGCTRCALSQSRINTVFGVGNTDADWMIIGEAPGAEEDRQGEPFVGRAGKLLDQMLFAIGQSRERVFIANILKCRPPNNRDPRPDVGRIAAQNLLGSDDPVGRMRGRAHELNGIPLVVTYHPAYLLRSPTQKRKSWSDLCLAKRLAAEAGT